jgi:hypothetical protein
VGDLRWSRTMFKWFENHSENNFRKLVRRILMANIGDFERLEGLMPHSTVEESYKSAWLLYGKPNLNKHPSIYQEECAKAAMHILDFYKVFWDLLESQVEKNNSPKK